jgi:uncharacterized membrane protein YgaE (UPF0421/DUF939 family)
MDFSEKKKEVIEKITGTLLDAMEQQLLSEEEGRVVAEYILSKKESFTNQEELIEFLQTLSDIWSIFTPLFDTEQKSTETESTDAKKLDEIKQQLSTLANMSH